VAAEVIDIGSVCPAVLQVQPSECLAYLFWPRFSCLAWPSMASLRGFCIAAGSCFTTLSHGKPVLAKAA
jgi:hypothetical protein